MKTGFRIGTTSYIIPADLVPNVEYLAGRVDDVELILFELDDGCSNLPDDETLDRLGRLAADNELSYTVHLPLDLELGAVDRPDHPSMVKAASVIERMLPVDPWAYVVHLEGADVLAGDTGYDGWRDRSISALEALGERAGGCELLAVENLEGYPIDFLDPVLESIGVSWCVDLGHLWLEGHDALSILGDRLPRTRVVHLHGIGTRDHQSLLHLPPSSLHQLRELLRARSFDGVVTIEVFEESDLLGSLEALAGAAACPDDGGPRTRPQGAQTLADAP